MRKIFLYLILFFVSASCFALPVYRDIYTNQLYYRLPDGKVIFPEDLRIKQKNPFDVIRVGEEKAFDFALNYGETTDISAYSDSDCIEINYKNGIPYVKAIKPGDNVSIMRYAYGPLASREAEKTIKVLPPSPSKINITLKDKDTKAKVTKWQSNDAIDSLSVPLGEVIVLKTELMPYNDYYPEVKYFSSDPDALSVSKESGEVEPILEGVYSVSVVCGDKKQKINIEVLPYEVESVKIKCKDKKIENNQIKVISWEKLKLEASIIPDEAKKNKTSWSSSNEKVAKVLSDGTVIFTGRGNVTVTVNVSDKTDGVDIKVTSLYLIVVPSVAGVIILIGLVIMFVFLAKRAKQNKKINYTVPKNQEQKISQSDINNDISPKDDDNGLFPD